MIIVAGDCALAEGRLIEPFEFAIARNRPGQPGPSARDDFLGAKLSDHSSQCWRRDRSSSADRLARAGECAGAALPGRALRMGFRMRSTSRHHYTGKLSCFRAGISTFLPLSIPSARASRLRVARGMITSSI